MLIPSIRINIDINDSIASRGGDLMLSPILVILSQLYLELVLWRQRRDIWQNSLPLNILQLLVFSNDFWRVIEVLGVLALALALVGGGLWPQKVLRKRASHIHLGLNLGGLRLSWPLDGVVKPRHVGNVDLVGHYLLLAIWLLIIDCLGAHTDLTLNSLGSLLALKFEIKSLLDFVCCWRRAVLNDKVIACILSKINEAWYKFLLILYLSLNILSVLGWATLAFQMELVPSRRVALHSRWVNQMNVLSIIQAISSASSDHDLLVYRRVWLIPFEFRTLIFWIFENTIIWICRNLWLNLKLWNFYCSVLWLVVGID